MSVGLAPQRPLDIGRPRKHLCRTYRSWLMVSVSEGAIAYGMTGAELAEKQRRIEDWIAAHPQEARRLSREVEAGKYGAL